MGRHLWAIEPSSTVLLVRVFRYFSERLSKLPPYEQLGGTPPRVQHRYTDCLRSPSITDMAPREFTTLHMNTFDVLMNGLAVVGKRANLSFGVLQDKACKKLKFAGLRCINAYILRSNIIPPTPQ